MPVRTAREVIVRRRVTSVGMYNKGERLEFLEDPVDRRRTHVRARLLNLASDLVGGEVVVRTYQDLNDGALGQR